MSSIGFLAFQGKIFPASGLFFHSTLHFYTYVGLTIFSLEEKNIHPPEKNIVFFFLDSEKN